VPAADNGIPGLCFPDILHFDSCTTHRLSGRGYFRVSFFFNVGDSRLNKFENHMSNLTIFVIALAALAAGIALGVFFQHCLRKKNLSEAHDLALRIIEEARKEAQAQKKEILLQGQNEVFSQKHAMECEYKDQERALKNREKKLQDISDRMEEKLERITLREHDILQQEGEQAKRERLLADKEARVEAVLNEQEKRLQEVSGLTAEEAKQRLFQEIESKTRHESAKMIRVIETEAKETADRKAKQILACAIQRYAGDYVGEQTVTAVTLPSEDMKGRIIGREGRNIRALEAATGVDLIIDDTPETVILSAYSPLRRQVARMALEKLIQVPGKVQAVPGLQALQQGLLALLPPGKLVL